HWRSLCKAMPGLRNDKRFATATGRKRSAKALQAAIEERLKMRTADQWFATLDKAGVPCEIAKKHFGHEGEGLNKNPDAIANGWVVEYRHATMGQMWQTGLPFNLSKTPGKIWGPPPALGQHTREIMEWLGYSKQEVADLKQRGVIAWDPVVEKAT
ncbi:MAG: CoA transferase, partial [Chloroflexi bacterium]|nr:CoA transferase [Chloroflexota bacterium]